MALVQEQRLVSEAHLTALGEDFIAEVVNGEVVETSPAGARHGKTSLRVGVLLSNYVYDQGLGEVFSDQTSYVLEGAQGDIRLMRVPDVSFIAKGNLPEGGVPEGFFYQAPDLAVEIVSPGDTATDVIRRVTDYLRAGTKAVWVVYPETRQVAVHTGSGATILSQGQALEGGAALPGFSAPVSALFE